MSRRELVSKDQLSSWHFDAVIAWIMLATQMGDGGISKGYDLLRHKWHPAYPETTGYTIPSLLNAALSRDRADLQELGLNLAQYLLRCSTPEGGVVHWKYKAVPIVFDTGQVMFGWLAAYDHTKNPVYLDQAQRAGDWLISIQDASGAWIKNQHLGVTKVIDTRVAWVLLELCRRTGNLDYQDAAVRNLNWALLQQDSDGWFKQCSFKPTEDPFTHTLVYTAEGLYESGLILGEDRYIDAGRKTGDALLSLLSPAGMLFSTFQPGWKSSSRSCCLTGNAQAANLWLRLYENNGGQHYFDAAVQALIFLAGTQTRNPISPHIKGAIAGSYPITGKYERLKYPNWAAKFFLDALLSFERVQTGTSEGARYKG
jgi:hypothetical protein